MEELKNNNLYKYIAMLSVAGIMIFLVINFLIPVLKSYENYPLYLVIFIGGGILLVGLFHKILHLEFGTDLVAGVSIVTSVILEQYLAGSLVVLMLSGGQALERYAIGTASKGLEALAKRAPTIAHRKQNEVVIDISIEKIEIGDTLVIFPHEICPVDGEVIKGKGVMDESYLTGEPFLLSKAPGSEVISGAVNGDEALVVIAKKLAIDSRYAKIMQVMKESEQKRPKMRRLADQLGAWFTPFSILIAGIAWIVTGEAIRFLSVLVVATPCPLLIAIPVAIIGSISLSARLGILIKNPIVLEQLDQCKTMIFDKTGTLTYGKPILTEQIFLQPVDERKVLQLVASVERYSKHPLARAVLEKALEGKMDLVEVSQIREAPGEGLEGVIEGHKITLTSRMHLKKLGLADKVRLLPEGEGLECVIVMDGELVAYYRFHDTPRKESRSFVSHLLPKHRFEKVMIVSGDREEEVKYMADFMGISEIYANKSPEEKVDIVLKETRMAKTAYLGDGINDAPALMVASVGIAFGRNSDVTAEAAGAVVMDDSLQKVDEFIHISRRMRTIGLQSAIGGILLSVLGMIAAFLGLLSPVQGAITQEVIDVLAILNSLRTVWRPASLTDMPFFKYKSC